MAKATKAQIVQRLNAVLKLRLGGVAIREIFQYSQDHNWGVGYDALYKYVGKADAIITERAERDRDRLLELTEKTVGFRPNQDDASR